MEAVIEVALPAMGEPGDTLIAVLVAICVGFRAMVLDWLDE
jgi:hypothetical protein